MRTSSSSELVTASPYTRSATLLWSDGQSPQAPGQNSLEISAERVVAVKQDPELEQELVRQNSLGYGGLIAIGVVMVQPFLTAAPVDVSARICIVAFSVAIPLLAALVLVNRQEVFRRRRTSQSLSRSRRWSRNCAPSLVLPQDSGTSCGSPGWEFWRPGSRRWRFSRQATRAWNEVRRLEPPGARQPGPDTAKARA